MSQSECYIIDRSIEITLTNLAAMPNLSSVLAAKYPSANATLMRCF